MNPFELGTVQNSTCQRETMNKKYLIYTDSVHLKNPKSSYKSQLLTLSSTVLVGKYFSNTVDTSQVSNIEPALLMIDVSGII